MPCKTAKAQASQHGLNFTPGELRPVFDELVVDYRGLAVKHHKGAWGFDLVLADLPW